MAARVLKQKGKFRVVNTTNKETIKNSANKPVDGGGYENGSAAEKHAAAINRAGG